MITELFLNVCSSIPILLLDNLLPMDFSIAIPDAFFSGLRSILSGIGFFFPVTALLPILIFSFVLKNAQVLWALILRIKSFIPTMGA